MMVALIPCLILMVAFAIQGALNLRGKRIAPRNFATKLRKARQEGGYKAARDLIEREPHSLAQVIRNVDDHLRFNAGADPAEVLKHQIEDECDTLLQENSQLGIIYRISPLLGLLGTVFGMIQTFNEFAQSVRPDVRELSVGINVALITTAWGLSIAIPAYLILYLLQRRVANYEHLVLPQEGADALHALLDRPIVGSSENAPLPSTVEEEEQQP